MEGNRALYSESLEREQIEKTVIAAKIKKTLTVTSVIIFLENVREMSALGGIKGTGIRSHGLNIS